MITKDEAQDLAERLDLTTKLVAWGYGGSRMYGLETATSDYDVVLVTADVKPGPEIHADMGNKQDVWAMSLGSYIQGVGSSKPNYVFLSIASTMHWNSSCALYTLAKSQAINIDGLLDSLYRHAKSDCHVFCEKEFDDPRGDKTLRVAIRSIITMDKLINSLKGGPTLDLRFTAREKANLKLTFDTAKEYHGMPAHVWHIVENCSEFL